MSRAAVSIAFFGSYLLFAGALLALVPERTCRMVNLAPPGDLLWVRVTGVMFLTNGFYYSKAAVEEQLDFMRWTIMTRPLGLVAALCLVSAGYGAPSLVIVGALHLVAALWTMWAIRADRLWPVRGD